MVHPYNQILQSHYKEGGSSSILIRKKSQHILLKERSRELSGMRDMLSYVNIFTNTQNKKLIIVVTSKNWGLGDEEIDLLVLECPFLSFKIQYLAHILLFIKISKIELLSLCPQGKNNLKRPFIGSCTMLINPEGMNEPNPKFIFLQPIL